MNEHQSAWPRTASDDDGTLVVGGCRVTDLVAEFGSPLWVVDEADLRGRAGAYRDAFPGADVAYASKAWPAVGILQIVHDEGLLIDVASGGELHSADRAGIPMDQVVFHGNAKSGEELRMAARLGVGRIVVDSFEELDRLEAIGTELGHVFTVWLRVTPGIDAHTHEFVRTGQDDSKFGFTVSLGLADDAVRRARDLDHVDLVGIHAHIGSQIFGTEPFVANTDVLFGLLARWRDELDVALGEVNLGGGMGIRYTDGDDPVSIADYGAAVLDAVDLACAHHDLPRPRVVVEPGRAIVGTSTVTAYTVEVVKDLDGIRRYIAVDGGMSDNIRPALYDAEHEIMLANRSSEVGPVTATVVGKHCESGDLVHQAAVLPGDVMAGDVLAVAGTGAYTAAMASNYNRLPRPAAVLVRDGVARLLVRRETYDDVVARDVDLA